MKQAVLALSGGMDSSTLLLHLLNNLKLLCLPLIQCPDNKVQLHHINKVFFHFDLSWHISLHYKLQDQSKEVALFPPWHLIMNYLKLRISCSQDFELHLSNPFFFEKRHDSMWQMLTKLPWNIALFANG